MRQLITDAARHLFVTEGFERTTIRRIAEAIQYTPGAIYSYFEDKDAILYALHQQGFIELQRRFLTAVQEGGNPGEQLRRVGEAYLAFARENAEMYHLMFLAEETRRILDKEEQWPEGQAAYNAMRALVQLAIATGWLRPGDPDVVAFALWGCVHGMVTLEICNRQTMLPALGRDAMNANAFTYMLDSLLREPAGEEAEVGPSVRRAKAGRPSTEA